MKSAVQPEAERREKDRGHEDFRPVEADLSYNARRIRDPAEDQREGDSEDEDHPHRRQEEE